eukprot:SAG31_NODE_37838_length_301_cov_0.752475_1_plen_24_part_10
MQQLAVKRRLEKEKRAAAERSEKQ